MKEKEDKQAIVWQWCSNDAKDDRMESNKKEREREREREREGGWKSAKTNRDSFAEKMREVKSGEMKAIKSWSGSWVLGVPEIELWSLCVWGGGGGGE